MNTALGLVFVIQWIGFELESEKGIEDLTLKFKLASLREIPDDRLARFFKLCFTFTDFLSAFYL